MGKAIGAYLDESGHEIQVIDDRRQIDVDALLVRLDVAHDAADMWSTARAAVRAVLVVNADASDAEILSAISGAKHLADEQAARRAVLREEFR